MAAAMADLVHPRQREAAAILLGAIELPAPAADVARAWIAAAKVCPGIKADAAVFNSRRAGLQRAAAIIAELLEEETPS